MVTDFYLEAMDLFCKEVGMVAPPCLNVLNVTSQCMLTWSVLSYVNSLE